VLLTVIPKKISAEVSQDNKRKYGDRINGSSNRMQGMNKIRHDKQCNANILDLHYDIGTKMLGMVRLHIY